MRLIAFAYLVHFLRHGMVFPLIPLFAQGMGYSGAAIGAAVSAFSVLSLLAAVPVGSLSDRLGTRTMLLLSALFNTLYSLLLLMADSIWLLVPAQMIGGLGFLLLIVSSQTWVSENTDAAIRERGFGFLSLAAAVGQTLGPFLGGFLLSRTSFSAVFSLAVVFSLLGFSIAALRDGQHRRSAGGQRSRASLKQTVAWLSGDRTMCAILLFTFVIVFAVSLRSSFIPVLFTSQGLSESSIGLLLSAFALSMTLVRVFIGRILGRFRRRQLLVLALGLVLLGTATLPAVSAVWLSTGIMLLFGMGFGISQPLSMVMVSDRAGQASGLAMGIRFSVITLATLLSPILSGLVVDGLGLEAAFFCIAGMLCAAGLVIWLVAREPAQP
jgi:MFS family permease